MQKLSLWVACVTVALASACAPPSGAATLKGRVVLKGVADAAGIPVAIAGPSPGATTTDATGAWHLDHLRPGSYAVTVDAPSTVERSKVTAAVVADTGTATAPTLTFAAVGSVAGTVIMASGAPAPSGTLVVAAETSAEAATAVDGTFILRRVPVGPATIIASVPGIAAGAKASATVAWGQRVAAPSLVLGTATKTGTGGVVGAAYLNGLAPTTQVTVTLQGPIDAATHPDNGGHYAFAGLPGGTYMLSAAASATREGAVTVPVIVTDGVNTVAPPLALTPVGTVEGMATLGGASAGNAAITVLVTGASGSAVGYTDDTGHYSVPAAPLGQVTVEAAYPGYGVARTNLGPVGWNATVSAPGLRLEPAGTGTASLATVRGVATPVGLTDGSGIQVALRDDTGAVAGSATTDASGRWTVPGIAPGLYSATFDRGAYHETIPALIAMPGTDGFVVDGGILPLAPLEVPRASRVVTLPRIRTATFSADGHEALVTAVGPPPLQPATVAAVDLATGRTRILRDLWPSAVQLSADGAFAFFEQGAPYPSSAAPLYALPTSGGPVVELVGRPVDPAYLVLPDGRHLVAVTTTGASSYQFEVLLVAADGSPPRVLLSGDSYDHLGQLSPDGRQLLVIAPGALKIVTLATSDVVTVPGAIDDAHFLPAGDKVVLLTYDHDPNLSYDIADLHVAAVTTGTDSPLATKVLPGSITVTPDESRIVYQDGASTQDGAILSVAADGSAAPVPLSQGTPNGRFVLLSDGSRVVLISSADGRLYSVPVAGGAATPLGTQGVGDFSVVQGASQPARVVFTAAASGQLYSVPVAGGTAVTLSSQAVGGFEVVQDGSQPTRVVFTAAGNGQLYSIPVAGGTAVALSNQAVGSYRVLGNGSKIAWLQGCTQDGSCKLEIAPIAGGATNETTVGVSGVSGLVFSPDGSSVFYLERRAVDRPWVGTLMRSSIGGGPAVEVLPEAWGLWSVGGRLLVDRVDAHSPYRFQEGLYHVSLP